VIETSNTQLNFYLYDATITVRRHIYAPYLSTVKVLKQKQIEKLIGCYEQLYGEDEDLLELVKHVDNAFRRDSTCKPYFGGEVLSAGLRSIGYGNAIVRGIIYIPPENIIIESRIVTLKERITTWNVEYVEPGTELKTKLQINIENLKSVQLYIGNKRSKGYGMVDINFSAIK
jgi:CRISPR/Cas system CSM-associated protein Csm3 (group 7 of RAMP superfamily)